MNQARFEVPEVHCDHCKTSIENAVIALEGVSNVDVKIEERVVDVSWDDDKVASTTIVTAIEDQGYSVTA